MRMSSKLLDVLLWVLLLAVLIFVAHQILHGYQLFDPCHACP